MNLINLSLWSARISSALAASFIMFFVLAHLLGEQEKSFLEISNPQEIALFMVFPVSTLFGLIFGWKNQTAGGVIILLSVLGYHVMANMSALTLIDVFCIPGILFLTYVWLKSKQT